MDSSDFSVVLHSVSSLCVLLDPSISSSLGSELLGLTVDFGIVVGNMVSLHVVDDLTADVAPVGAGNAVSLQDALDFSRGALGADLLVADDLPDSLNNLIPVSVGVLGQSLPDLVKILALLCESLSIFLVLPISPGLFSSSFLSSLCSGLLSHGSLPFVPSASGGELLCDSTESSSPHLFVTSRSTLEGLELNTSEID